MNNAGVLTHLYDQLKTYKAETGTSARKDGVALLMSSQTWVELQSSPVPAIGPIPPEEVLNTKTRMVMGCRVITSSDPPLGDIFVVLPSSHRFLKVKKPSAIPTTGFISEPTVLSSEGKITLGNVPVGGIYTITIQAPSGANKEVVHHDDGTVTVDGHNYAYHGSLANKTISDEPSLVGIYQQQHVNWGHQDPSMTAYTWLPGDDEVPNKVKTKYTEEVMAQVAKAKAQEEMKWTKIKTSAMPLPKWEPNSEEMAQLKKELASAPITSVSNLKFGELSIASDLYAKTTADPVPPSGAMSYDAETNTTWVADGQGGKHAVYPGDYMPGSYPKTAKKTKK